jgi:dihydropteroate synthase
MNAGASLINDISAGMFDAEMIPTAVGLKVPYVLMHMKGRPETMQQDIHYDNVTIEVLDFFIKKTAELRAAGLHDIIIDPGIGFGKNIANNFELLKNLRSFSILPHPLLLGISRKSTIYKTLGVTAEESLNGTTALHTIGLMNGAMILRAHDVKEAMETIRLWQACMH